MLVDQPGLDAASPTPEQTNDKEQNDGSQQRYQQTFQAKVVLVDGADPKHGAQEVAREERAYDTNHDIQEQALPPAGSHDHTCDPTNKSSCDKPDYEVHFLLLYV
jgi:hypothetical protein